MKLLKFIQEISKWFVSFIILISQILKLFILILFKKYRGERIKSYYGSNPTTWFRRLNEYRNIMYCKDKIRNSYMDAIHFILLIVVFFFLYKFTLYDIIKLI